MIEREPGLRCGPESVASEAEATRPFPSLEHTLTIARLGSQNPASLTVEDIEDLSRVALMHYARMVVA